MFKKTLIVLISSVALTACQDDHPSYSWLMRHPMKLKNEVETCRQGASSERTAHCEMVEQVANAFATLLDEQQNSPEQFGQRILDAQIACAEAYKMFAAEEQAFAVLKQQNPTEKELEAGRQKVAFTKKQFDEKREQVAILLAVASVNSPE